MQDGKSQVEVLCVGGAVVDLTYRAHARFRPGTSNPASGTRSFGGVARNVAVNLARLGIAASLVSVLGADEAGRALAEDLAHLGVDTSGLRKQDDARTAEYLALLEPDGSLALGVADMAVLERLGVDDIAGAPGSAWIFADCNCPGTLLTALLRRPDGRRLAIDAVSSPKAGRLPERLDGIDLLFLNLDEAAAVLGRDAASLDAARAIDELMARGAASVVLTLGADGLVLGTGSGAPLHVPALPTPIVDVTGAGDALIAGTLAGLVRGDALNEAVRVGTAAAALTLGSAGGTSPRLNVERLARIVTTGSTLPSPE